MWIIDFGVGMPEHEAALYEGPFECAAVRVRPERVKSKTTITEWWLHERPRVEMRAAIAGLPRFLATARVAKHRLFVWLDGSTLPDSQIIAFARDDDYFFGVLHSHAHEVWSLRMGTSLEDRPRYTPTTCFETFPFPCPTAPQREEIAAAAKELDSLRRGWLDPPGATEAELKKRTLTNLYNQRPAWLAHAHARLDRAVRAAYGWDDPDPAATEEDTILARLLALNLQQVAASSSLRLKSWSPVTPGPFAASQDLHAVNPGTNRRPSTLESPPLYREGTPSLWRLSTSVWRLASGVRRLA